MRRTWADEFSGGSVLVVVGGLLLAVAGDRSHGVASRSSSRRSLWRSVR